LARKARGLRKGVILEGWLYQTARLTAVTHIRSEIRRSRREQKASMQTISNENEGDAWSQIVPLLDGALAGLNETDRNAVVLRFFYGKSLREVGVALGASEDSARMRINRSLEKLREYFFRRGVTSTTAMIAGAISANSVQAAPAALAKLATAAALAKGAAGSTSTAALTKGVLKLMAWSKMQTTIVGAVIVGMAAYSVMEHQGQTRLRAQNETLRKQMTQLLADNDRLQANSREQARHLAATGIPAITAPAIESPTGKVASTNLFERLKDQDPKLTAEQADAFLQANGRRPATLLAAYRTSKDLALLREAMAKFPDDPQVAFETVTSPWLTADEKRPWLKTFEQAAPDNALAYYLSAVDDLKAGRTDDAMREMAGASGKHFDDYTQGRVLDDVDVFLSAGYSPAEAQMLSSSSLLIPQASSLKDLGVRLVDLANTYRQAGDQASAQAVLQMAMNLGQTVGGAPSSAPVLIDQLVAMAIQNKALGAMDPNSVYGENGQTAQDLMNQIAQNKATINALNQQAQPLMPKLTEEDMINFMNRRMLFGEVAAMHWVVNKYGQQ
jgi:RNA polymerase sigma factor (sigma-70 family)